MDIYELVELGLSNHPSASQLGRDAFDPVTGARVGSGLVRTLGWIAASTIISAFYVDYGMDALPRYDYRGWDGFHLTRQIPQSGSALTVVGTIEVTGCHAPSIAMADGTEQIVLGNVPLSDLARTIATTLDRIRPRDSLPTRALQPSWKQQRRFYPLLYRAATELVIERPGLIVARELFIDDQEIDGAFHPLFLHSDGAGPHLTYDWILIQMGEECLFIRIHGGQVIYEREAGVWAAANPGLVGASVPVIKDRISDWLHLEKNIDIVEGEDSANSSLEDPGCRGAHHRGG